MQQNEGSQENQEDSKRKSAASTTAHESDLSDFHLSLDGIGVTDLLRLGHAWVVSGRDCFAEVFFPHVISFLSTHHEVLDRRLSGCFGPFLSRHFVRVCNLAACGVRSAELLLLSNLLYFGVCISLTLCYVMLATSSSLSLTPLTYLAGRF